MRMEKRAKGKRPWFLVSKRESTKQETSKIHAGPTAAKAAVAETWCSQITQQGSKEAEGRTVGKTNIPGRRGPSPREVDSKGAGSGQQAMWRQRRAYKKAEAVSGYKVKEKLKQEWQNLRGYGIWDFLPTVLAQLQAQNPKCRGQKGYPRGREKANEGVPKGVHGEER